MKPLGEKEMGQARRWFAYLRDRRREVVSVETRLANLLGCHASKVFNEVTLGVECDDEAFAELLRIAGHTPPEPDRGARLFDVLELLRERQGFRRGKHA